LRDQVNDAIRQRSRMANRSSLMPEEEELDQAFEVSF
jgi:hypothetical protein